MADVEEVPEKGEIGKILPSNFTYPILFYSTTPGAATPAGRSPLLWTGGQHSPPT